jgi:hypothetical protein
MEMILVETLFVFGDFMSLEIIAAGCGAGRRVFDSRQWREVLLYPTASRSALEPT